MYDDAENLKYEYLNSSQEIPADTIQQYIIDVSQTLARTLYEEITQQQPPKDLTEAQNFTLVSLIKINEFGILFNMIPIIY